MTESFKFMDVKEDGTVTYRPDKHEPVHSNVQATVHMNQYTVTHRPQYTWTSTQ
jgi:hypothetical protein